MTGNALRTHTEKSQMLNPYAPSQLEDVPAETVTENSVARGKLYSAGQIAWATFIGSIFAGSVLMAINYHRMGEPKSVRNSLVLGVLGMIGLTAISFAFPDEIPSSLFTILSTVSLYQIAKGLQIARYRQHLMNGGFQASSWAATGIGCLCSILYIAILFGIIMLLPETWMLGL